MAEDRCDADYQRAVSEYVHQHVYYCASELVSEVGPHLINGTFPNYEDEYEGLFQTEPDRDDCENEGFKFLERDSDWYYEKTDEDVEDEVLGEFSLLELAEFADDEFGYSFLDDNTTETDLDADEIISQFEYEDFKVNKNHYGQDKPQTYTVWKPYDINLCEGPFDDEDEAVENCVRNNDVRGCDVYEHWIISDHLAYKLKQYGQTVKDFFGLTIWCRTCTGQCISLDHVICEIFNEVESYDK